jgi:ferrous iron transport protein B
VEKKEGFTRVEDRDFYIVDLPGTYSLTAYSQEELVARNYLVEEVPHAVVNVVNAGALERNLYLTVQFLEMGIPLVLALNMIDEAEKQGLTIDHRLLSNMLGVPVVPTVARTGRGGKELMRQTAEHALARQDQPWTPLSISYGPDLDPVLDEMEAMIREADFLTDRYPPRWLALKYLEHDEEILILGRKAGKLSEALEEKVAHVSEHCQATLNTYPEAIIADYRYGFIASVMRKGVVTRSDLHDRIAMSDRLDRVLTHRLAGPLIMVAVLFAVYQVTFVLGEYPMGWLEALFGWMGRTVDALLPDGLLQSLLVSGIIDGVGGVLSFVPLIMIIFLLIAFLEDSGYMARIAYMLDRVFRIFGLHGCSVMPFIVSGGIGGGCAVPGVLASRTLRSRKEKLATLLTAPFMTCGAKLPVFILLVGVFFPSNEALALFLITLFAWAMALVVAKVLRSTVIRGPSTPFVMELPPYRLPTLRGVLIHTWERTWQYIRKAGTVILAISIILWAAMTFPQPPEDVTRAFESTRQDMVQQLEQSRAAGEDTAMQEDMLAYADDRQAAATLGHTVAGRVGTALEPVSQYAGFDWRTNIALVGGFAAKEVIVSTLGTAYSLGEVDPEETSSLKDRLRNDPDWSRATGVSMIIFVLLYAPCFVTVAAIRQEAGGWGWALFSMGFNTAFAFGLAVVAYQAGTALTG